ncbi:MAG: peptidylprolyl isomerase [Flavobacteriaceae bacterium]|nr:peptidylprolyl isomerase [Flavobacteriaceae bacterium]
MEKIRVILALFFLTLLSCNPKIFKEHWTKKQAPEVFTARFETTKGNFDIEAHRRWSPHAVDRLYQLIKNEFYTEISLFRVVPNFVAQFGIHNDSIINNSWQKFKVPDEPSLKKNVEGTIAFARSGKETRSTQLFINLKSNSPRLDTIYYNGVKGFPVIAKVTKGMSVVKSFYNQYGEDPGRRQDSIRKYGNRYLKKTFPNLDYITKAYILKNR